MLTYEKDNTTEYNSNCGRHGWEFTMTKEGTFNRLTNIINYLYIIAGIDKK